MDQGGGGEADAKRKREGELGEFLKALLNYSPTLSEEVTRWYLQRAGVDCADERILRLISLAADKLMAETMFGAKQFARKRRRQEGGGGGSSSSNATGSVVTPRNSSGANANGGGSGAGGGAASRGGAGEAGSSGAAASDLSEVLSVDLVDLASSLREKAIYLPR